MPCQPNHPCGTLGVSADVSRRRRRVQEALVVLFVLSATLVP
jgi:hypothetical protein